MKFIRLNMFFPNKGLKI